MVRAYKKNLSVYSQRKDLRFFAITAAIAILVVAAVFWWLKLTGITMSNEAFCGYTEHQHSEDCIHKEPICSLGTEPARVLVCTDEAHGHSEACYEELSAHEHVDACYKAEYLCGEEEHIHTAICFSNLEADLETKADWEATLPGRTGDWRQDIVMKKQSIMLRD